MRRHIREERKEDLRLHRIEVKKREGRRRILQSDLPLYVPPSFSYLPALYNMYDAHVIDRHLDAITPITPKHSAMDSIVSRRSSAARFRTKTPSGSVLPRINTPGRHDPSSPFKRGQEAGGHRFKRAVERRMGLEFGQRSPLTLIKHGTKGIPGSRRPLHGLDADHKDQVVGDSGAVGGQGSPKGLTSHLPKEVARSPKGLSHSPKERGQTPKELSHSPKELAQSPKGSSPSSKELGQSPKQSGFVPKGLPKISSTRSLVAASAAEETSAAGKSKPKDSLRGVSPEKGRVARARRERDFTDENRRL